jgi:hypothetical protein
VTLSKSCDDSTLFRILNLHRLSWQVFSLGFLHSPHELLIKLAQAAALLIYIREILGSTLCRDTNCSYRALRGFPQPHQENSSIVPATAAVCFLFSNHPVIRSMLLRMMWAGHVARMGEKRNAYRILVGKRPLGRPRRKWVYNNKMDKGWWGMDWKWIFEW